MYSCVSWGPVLLVTAETYRGLSKRKRCVQRTKKEWRNDGGRKEKREGRKHTKNERLRGMNILGESIKVLNEIAFTCYLT